MYQQQCNQQSVLKEYLFSDFGDQSFLQKNYSSRLGFYLKLSTVFISDIPPLLENLEQNVLDKSFESVRKIAHKSKNNYHWMGLHDISEMLKKVEHSCQNESLDWDAFDGLLEKMKIGLTYVLDEHEKVNAFLKETQ